MVAAVAASRESAVRLREARRCLQDAGALPHGLLEPEIHRSWQRSREYGLAPDGRSTGVPHASQAQLSRALEHRRAFVAHARPVMEFLSEQIGDSGSIVLLADSQGMLLQSLGDTDFADKAARVALRPGAVWHEQWRGTNAIGTTLAAGTSVVVHGAEHYLERNAFLTCAAAPIVDPCGQLLGVLDISGDHRGYHRHTLSLVRSAARMVEHQLFQARYGGAMQIRLHRQPEGIGTVTESLLAVADDGVVIAANTAALTLLGLDRAAIGRCTVEQALAVELATLLAGCGRGGSVARALQRDDGSPLWLRVDLGRSTFSVGPSRAATAATAQPVDALARLDTGDGATQALICRARRVLDKPIALLLQGESGVGKELFARACHESGPRRGKPWVAVNCAALPENLIEAELFGYRPGAFTGAGRDGAPGRLREAEGGTLFLDEIGDMPLAMQARLLRVLQERQVQPLGGGKPVPVNFQLICATHRKLRAEVDAGRFREDLYYRINGLALQLPPLRERGDLVGLVAAVLRELAPGRPVQLAPGLMAAFAAFRWPGNLRQMSNALRTACALLGDDETVIDLSHLPDDLVEELSLRNPPPLRSDASDCDLHQHAERCVREAMNASSGNLSEAARRLGVSRNTLYRKLRQQA